MTYSTEDYPYKPINNDDKVETIVIDDSFYIDEDNTKWYYVSYPTGHTHFNKFVAKVLSILLLQLAATIGIVILLSSINIFKDALKEYWYISLICGVVSIITLVMLLIFRHVAILNWVLFSIFTIGFSTLIASMTVYLDVYQILEATFITFIIVLTMIFLVLIMKVDCTHIAFIITSLCVILIWFALFAFLFTPMIYSNYYDCEYNYWYQLLILIYIFFYVGVLLLDLSAMEDFNYNEYIVATVQIYIDIMNIFVQFLLLAAANHN